MSQILEKNREFAETMKSIMRLRGEPVAVKLIPVGEDFPEGYSLPEEPVSHCQAVFKAREGQSMMIPLSSNNCMVGAAALQMTKTPEKVASGEFHAGMGMHDSVDGAREMIAQRVKLPGEYQGEVVCPLRDANFEPDVVAIDDIPERIYWIVPLSTAEKGGRITFSTAPFQCMCEDVVAVPMATGGPNISLGCFGCRKRTPMKADEMACGIPYSMIPGFVERLRKYEGGVMTKSKRE